MQCEKCGKTNHALIGSLCPSCFLVHPPTGIGLEPLYPGDIVEVLREDENHGRRGYVVRCASLWHTWEIWICLKASRDSEFYYAIYSRDELKLFSRYHAGRPEYSAQAMRE